MAGLNVPKGAFHWCSKKLRRGHGLTPAHDLGILETGRREGRSAGRPGTEAAKRVREARRARQNPVCRPCEGQGFLLRHTLFCFCFSDRAKKREQWNKRFLWLFRKGKAPGPKAAEARKGWGK